MFLLFLPGAITSLIKGRLPGLRTLPGGAAGLPLCVPFFFEPPTSGPREVFLTHITHPPT